MGRYHEVFTVSPVSITLFDKVLLCDRCDPSTANIVIETTRDSIRVRSDNTRLEYQLERVTVYLAACVDINTYMQLASDPYGPSSYT